jgi:hypothetical protein
VPLAESHHVVVDGSNLATEGRTFPSLEQLDQAVRAYAAEDPAASIIVVVDATFEHRVSDAEREEVRQAMLNGEVISPPAGAIGRGDAFVLRIAERTGATVLSNDSFQEFHGEHPWLFDDGRLIGGKPVPGVGWIFTPRLPIRGPKSRAATAEARAKKDPESAPAKAAELAKAAEKAAKKASKAQKGVTQQATPIDTSWPLTPAAPPPGRAKVNPVFSSAIDEAVEEALHPPQPQRSRGAAKKHAAAKKAAPPKGAKAKTETTSGHATMARGSHPRAESPPRQGPDQSQRKRSVLPPPAVNEPLTFINFVAAFAVGSTIEGEVVSFTSHGAMVDVPLPGGGALHCYIPLTAMGSPPPTKARQVLKKGEVRPFVLAGLDPPRRVAELALPSGAVASTPSPAKKAVAAKRAPTVKAAPSTKKAAAKKAASPAKQATKKEVASAKKAPKKAAVKKAAKAAQTLAKKAPAKKSPAKKAPAEKAPAEKSPAEKSPAEARQR